jgi:hypothetical protein
MSGYRSQSPEKGPKRTKGRSLSRAAFCAPPPWNPWPTTGRPAPDIGFTCAPCVFAVSGTLDVLPLQVFGQIFKFL